MIHRSFRLCLEVLLGAFSRTKRELQAFYFWPQLLMAGLFISSVSLRSADPSGSASPDSRDLKLAELRRLVMARNESILMKILDAEISQKAYSAERGIFEPNLVASMEHIDSQRPNNTQQLTNLNNAVEVLVERNGTYSSGLEFLLPAGTKLRLGYTLRDLNNNLQQFQHGEYETFIGTSLTQPLLRDFGMNPTMARIRLAGIGSDIAFHEHRRQSMFVLAHAEAAYWDLYLTQEQEKIGIESMTLAEKLLEDNRVRRDVGKSSDLEVLQAEAGLAYRKTRLNEARQKVSEGGIRLATFYSAQPGVSDATPRAIEVPEVPDAPSSHSEGCSLAIRMNPDYRIRCRQADQESVRLLYTKNQRLPQLDLKGSLGLNGLGSTPGQSWDDIEENQYAAWMVGFEFRVPLTGGIKGRNEHEAAKLSRRKALLAIKEIEVQLFNGIRAATQKVQLYADDVKNYQSVVNFHESLLKAQLDRLSVGGLDSKTVLETEAKLSETKILAVESRVLLCKALLELEVLQGSLLKSRNFEITKEQLKARVEDYFLQANIPLSAVKQYQQQAVADFEKSRAQKKAQR
jgi:outer membrane protein TolC